MVRNKFCLIYTLICILFVNLCMAFIGSHTKYTKASTCLKWTLRLYQHLLHCQHVNIIANEHRMRALHKLSVHIIRFASKRTICQDNAPTYLGHLHQLQHQQKHQNPHACISTMHNDHDNIRALSIWPEKFQEKEALMGTYGLSLIHSCYKM